MSPSTPAATGNRGDRDTKRLGRISPYPENVDRWAIIVGISKYQYDPWSLQYADRDAEELCKLIQTSTGGEFPTNNVRLLVNEEANTTNIRRLLRSFLKKPKKEDLVLIHFSCHGTPDPDRPENIYLLTYDTDPDDIAGTAILMREVGQAFQDTLLAERVVITADTCHSGATVTFSGRRGSGNEAAVINQYLKSLSGSQKGIAYLTSAEARETSREDAKWGGGHGVFTHYLLEGLRGKADRNPKDGIVTVGELFEYVRENVLDATDNIQHPYASEDYDRNLPMAITGGLAAREHYQLGCQLHTLGRLLDDPGRYESATRQFNEAIRLAEGFPEAYLARGRSLLALGRAAKAVDDFQQALNQDATLTQAWLDLGIAYAKKDDDTANAIRALESFLKHHPNDDGAPWIREFISQLQTPQAGDKYALLIGISQYADHQLNLKGPANDIPMMQALLVHRYTFPVGNIKIMTDAEATREGILRELSILQESTEPGDTVLVYYSGHASSGDAPTYLAPHDVSFKESRNTISAQEFHDAINRIPAGRKSLIMDTHVTYQFKELARMHANYTLFLATSPDEYAYEYSVEDEDRKYVGAFSYVFVKTLERLPADVTQGEILQQITNGLQLIQMKQTPLFFGSKDRPLFSRRGEQDYIVHFDFSQLQSYASLSLNQIQHRYKNIQESLAIHFPQIHYCFGQAFLDKGDYQQALAALQTAIEQRAGNYPEALIGLGIAQLRTQSYKEAINSFQSYLAAEPTRTDQLKESLQMLEQLVDDRKHALIVGIDRYPDGLSIKGAVNDCQALKQVLIDKYGFQETDIKLLLNTEATTDAIIEEFRRLVALAREDPALFYFAGIGSLGPGNTTMILSSDKAGYIELDKLVDLVGDHPTNLITIFDAGWASGVNLPWGTPPGSRFFPYIVPRDIEPPSGKLQSIGSRWQPDEEWREARDRVGAALKSLLVGRLVMYTASVQAAFGVSTRDGSEAIIEAEFPGLYGGGTVIHGALTYYLVEILQKSNPVSLTYSEWKKAMADRLQWLEPYGIGDYLEEVVFTNAVKESMAHVLLHQQIFQEPIRQVIPSLKRLIEQHDRFESEGYLNLGIAYAALGNYDQSIAALENAIEQQDESDYFEARYHLGRVLLESGRDLDRAVSELSRVKSSDPSNVRARYYHGQAIRARVEHESLALTQAEEDLQYYLDQGAPLGGLEEIQQFLRSRRQDPQRITR